MLSKKIRIFDSVLALMAFYYLSKLIYDASNDPGVGWHLKSGEWIWQNKAVMYHDPFLISETIRPWISDQWLSDLLMYLSVKSAGTSALAAILLTVTLLTIFSVLYSGLLRYSRSPLAVMVTLASVLIVWTIHFVTRPLIFSFFFFSLVLTRLFYLWQKGKENNEWQFTWNDISFFAAIFLLWCNLHPSFVLGFILLFIFFGSLLAENILGWSCIKKNIIIKFFITILSIILITAVNPYGFALHKSIIFLGNSEYFMQLNNEWFQCDFEELRTVFAEFLICFIALAATLKPNRFKNWGIFELGILLLAILFLFSYVRLLPYTAILLAFPASYSLKVIFEKAADLLGCRPFKSFIDDFNQIELEGHSLSIVVCLILGGITMFFPSCLIDTKKLSLLSGSHYPKDAIIALKKDLPSNSVKKLIASPNFGGCITYFGDGKIKAYLDDRNTLLGEKIYKKFQSNFYNEEKWEEYIKSLNADYVMIENGDKIKQAMEKKLQIIYSDKDVTVMTAVNNCEKCNG